MEHSGLYKMIDDWLAEMDESTRIAEITGRDIDELCDRILTAIYAQESQQNTR